MATGIAFGGPKDGAHVELPEDPDEIVNIWSEWYTSKEPPVRRWRKVYHYEQSHQYRAHLHYIGEDVVWEDEEVKSDGPA